MPLVQQIQKRVLDRARQVLSPIGQWPRCKRLVPAGATAQRLAAICPGDPRDYEIDHVRAIALWDLSRDEDVAQAFAPSNHQWLTRGANRRKGAR